MKHKQFCEPQSSKFGHQLPWAKHLHTISIWVTQETIEKALSIRIIVKRDHTMNLAMVYPKHDPIK